jgi:putative SOS response-associated peptidase YedK
MAGIMCGRFILLIDLSVLIERFAVEESALKALPGGDLLPGQEIPAIIHEGKNRLRSFRWGLIPSWAKEPAIGRKMINARAETIAEKASFKQAFRFSRCLIPATGFYEWTGEKGRREAVSFSLRSGEPFAFAGLYETWVPPGGEPIRTCTIVTTEANPLVASFHDRMPAILTRTGEAHWLDPSVHDPAALRPFLEPYPVDEMSMGDHHTSFR